MPCGQEERNVFILILMLSELGILKVLTCGKLLR
jgi:hypothetical protein